MSHRCDVLVVGGGGAALRAALAAHEAAPALDILLVTKGDLGASGVTATACSDRMAFHATLPTTAPGGPDAWRHHADDIYRIGGQVSDLDLATILAREAATAFDYLDRLGVPWARRPDGVVDQFHTDGSTYARACYTGPYTANHIEAALVARLRQTPIRVLERHLVAELLRDGEGVVCGALLISQESDALMAVGAGAVVLATGGAGQAFAVSVFPPDCTGDGYAMAYRAGAVLRDLEFMQFHPTTLYIAGASRALITETLRGEGAILRDRDGNAFMKDYHPEAELAPRDVVSRAILDRMLRTGSTHVYLDIRHFDKAHFQKRFPLISELCSSFDINVSKDMIPVRPSAHYMIGGVKVDQAAATSIPNLYACGEAASTGLHGANRLGSNSLLEGLVYGKLAGHAAAGDLRRRDPHLHHRSFVFEVPHSDRSRLDTEDVRNSLCALMWRNVGITREQTHLVEAQEIICFWQRYVMDKIFETPFGWECQNMLTVALLMARAAEARAESRGVHFRKDYPKTDNDHFQKHIDLS